jgi:Leucine-rich repeat (LRR) protein
MDIPPEIRSYINGIEKDEESIYIGAAKLRHFPDLSHFTNIITLRCCYNHLKSIPILPRTLQHLYCNNNLLDSLPILPMGLITLVCNNNELKRIPPLPPSVTTFICCYNQLLYLPELHWRTLTHFSCIRNPFIEYLRNGKRICIETINKISQIICRFRYLYYVLKYKWRFLEIAAKITMKPENISKMLQTNVLSLEMDELDSFNIL